ncbi:hypothetical protein [Azospirillum picis]|uniref:Uncharacterized protein n=1 Tax=Azospirillum picis TaxID=488438 RepID=A0ABU0MV14_9PROT|nr:hypothetical protein [Azospirillum picis]MBP2303441.1 hypothetical protein [Azospirillum picis]MDQ0537300.1 hypothetical protein [Azospirillum picis]
MFAGTRSMDLIALALRLAGFEVRDCIRSLSGDTHHPGWFYGSGIPKSLDVSKAIDKAAGAAREVIGEHRCHGGGSPGLALSRT